MAYNFVNPYNFIPLEKTSPKRTESGERKYSGKIHYYVLTKTPLFIPNTSTDDAFKMRTGELKGKLEEHRSLDFFSYTDLSNKKASVEDTPAVPVIPGSEMRGLVRSYFEILTNSCMSAAEDDSRDTILSKRTQEKYKPALLRKENNGSFLLFDAVDYLVRTFGENNLVDDLSWTDDNEHNRRKCYVQNQISEGQEVTFIPYDRPKNGEKPLATKVDPACNKGNGRRSGYFIKGEDGPEIINKKTRDTLKQQKHCGHIFALKTTSKGRYVDISSLVTVLNLYAENNKLAYAEYKSRFDKFSKNAKAGAYFPVYYSVIGNENHILLSPACITRELYQNTIRKMLRDHASCSKEGRLCPACRLFGTVVDSKNNNVSFSVCSRVRFSDLKPTESIDAKNYYLSVTTLKELSSPKLQNLEFYVKRPDGARFWTYDYYFNAEDRLKTYTPEPNGRKFYWHQDIGNRIPEEYIEPMPSGKMEPETLDKYKRNMTIRPLQKDVKFDGYVYFEDLTKRELDELIYVLECGEDGISLSEKKHGYKLGSGKPYGLGSIAMAVDKVNIVSYKADSDEHRIFRQVKPYVDRDRTPEFDKETLAWFKRMTNFTEVKGDNISYPLVEKPEPGKETVVYEWFSNNHKKYDRKNKMISEKGMPNSRSEMVYEKYMKPMHPHLQLTLEENRMRNEAVSYRKNKNNHNQNFKKKEMPFKKKEAVWIARYPLSEDMKIKLSQKNDSKILSKHERTEKNMLNQQLLNRLSEEYDILLISQDMGLEKNTYLLDFARKKFKKIYQSVNKKVGGKVKDYDWKPL